MREVASYHGVTTVYHHIPLDIIGEPPVPTVPGVDVIDYDGPEAVYRQLAAILRRKIESGEIPAGRAIPSKRTLTQTYGVSGMTVDRATAVLKEEGLILFAAGRGLFVAPRHA